MAADAGGRPALDSLAFLTPNASPAEPPIRAELFGPALFEQHGRHLAAVQPAAAAGRSAESFYPRLKDNVAVLHRARSLLERRAREGLHIGPTGHWLLDNAALIDEQRQAIRGALTRDFFRRLPRLETDPLAGLPRIVGVAWAYVAHSDSHLDAVLLEAFLSGYQQVRELTLAELWALPTTLRVVLLENLRRLAEHAAAVQAARDAAHHWFDGPEPRRTPAELDRLEANLAPRGVADAFWLQLQQRQDDLTYERCRELNGWLATRARRPADAEGRQQAEAVQDLQSIRNAITTLRHLDRVDWRALFGRLHAVMRALATCPVHAAENEESQDRTLQAIERLARRSGRSELDVAQCIVGLTREADDAEDARAAPVHWWGGEGEPRLREAIGLPRRRAPTPGSVAQRRLATGIYLPAVAAATLAGVAWMLYRQADPGQSFGALLLTALLLLAPASEAVVAVFNRLISESLPPRLLPRMAWSQGIPSDHRTLVVVPTMLTSAAGAAALAARLEQHYLANPEAQAQFALLTDFTDAAAPETADDAALLAAARAAIEALNQQHGSAVSGAPLPFLLLHRPRRWSETQQAFIGWERKRGKLEELLALLATGHIDANDPAFVDLGPLSTPTAGVRHLVTLDSDTDMPPGRLRALVAVAAHPVNLPRLDAAGRRVLAGYGVLQPRIVTPMSTAAYSTWFHSLFSGQTGVDPYSAASSEVYLDLFGEGTYTGKGLLDVAAAHAVLANRLPNGQVLSHDLLEGSLLRCAGVSAVAFVEDAPLHADVAASRLHRWTRGDWQLLPFLRWRGRDGLAMINRWKMIDNLRRSLVAPGSLALLLWVIASGALPVGWALTVVLAAYGAGPLLGAIAGLAPRRDDLALKPFFDAAGRDLLRALFAPLWHAALLLDQALMYADAIARALWRHFVSRRQLLQWLPAAQAQSAARVDAAGLLRRHAPALLAAGALAAVAALASALGHPPAALRWGAGLLLVWAAAPLWVGLVSRPRARPRRERMRPSERAYLCDVARETWRFYERHVGPADHHLPPDNVQMTPQPMVAHRTSPTNIGLYLTATACAQELGFIGRVELAERVGATLDTLERLPRWHGHFFNWLDTRSLAVLQPAYVSTVDSGNLSAHLLALASACAEAGERAAPDGGAGAASALAASAERLHSLQPVLSAAPSLRALARLAAASLPPAPGVDLGAVHALVDEARAELDTLGLGRGAGDDSGPLWRLHDHVSTLASQLRDRAADADALGRQLHALAARARRIALAPDYARLYDRQRRLLHIGLRADTGQLDEAHYDLLASEARLTSLVGIAKGDLPAEHWAALGRPFFACGTEVGLKSWSGSMFEYLMPSLLLDEPRGSVLGQAVRSAVSEQRDEASSRDTPWGISESAIASQDHTLAYQYGPQGAARLALRRTPPDERVLAPYATALAGLVAPTAAVANLQALQALGARRTFGFIEALDYTPTRQVDGRTFTAVHTYMAHHQAMSLVAATDLLTDGVPRRWALADSHLRAVASLLHERPPREVPRLADPPRLPPPSRPTRAHLLLDQVPLADTLPATLLLGHGDQGLWIRSHGGGVSRWQADTITRWRDDLPRDEHGSFIYLRRDAGAPWHSITAHPAPDPEARYHARLLTDRALFDARWEDLHARSTVWLSPEDGTELRRVELSNAADAPLDIELAFAAEVTLAPPAADETHPAFSNLFVRARWDVDHQALYLQRRPRLPDEQALWAVFFVAGRDGEDDATLVPLDVTPCVDRARWQGRLAGSFAPHGDGGYAALPTPGPQTDGSDANDDDDGAPGVPLDTGFDPVAVLRLRLRLDTGTRSALTFGVVAGRSPIELAAAVDKYRQATHVRRASDLSHTMAGVRLREMPVDAEQWRALLRLQTLLSATTLRDLPAPADHAGAAWRCERRLLWRFGLSGERAMVLVHIDDEAGVPLVQLLKRALRLWSAAGLGVDLVVINGEPASYLLPVQRQLQMLRERQQAQIEPHWSNAERGQFVLLAQAELGQVERETLTLLARVRLMADGRTLAQQLDRLLADWQPDATAEAPPAEASKRTEAEPEPQTATALAPLRRLTVPRLALGAQARTAPAGRFDAADGRFVADIDTARAPSRPWVNVLANPQFGMLVSEAGSGMTWAQNSRMHALTPWSNDPLADPPGEWLLLHDVERDEVWPLARTPGDGRKTLTHGIGFTRMQQRVAGLEVTLTWCVDAELPVRQLQLSIENGGERARSLRLVALVEWQLGGARFERQSVDTRAETLPLGPRGVGLPVPPRARVLLATQIDPTGGFGDSTAFLAWRLQDGTRPDGWTCDRREFFDAAGHPVLPTALGRRAGLGLDPCGAVACIVTLAPGAVVGPTLLLGHATRSSAALDAAAQALAVDPVVRLQRQRAQWPERLGSVRVATPDPLFDALVNHWLPYQTVASRLWARAGFYQAGGAYGFRDQLQDAMNLVAHDPSLLAQQIRRHAARQFPEGDVQHWWHEPGGAGVRTHFSDDLLWLPLALALHVERSGDTTLLDETLPFLAGGAVPPGREDLYETPQPQGDAHSLYEHGARAIDQSLRTGTHGLPLMGTGDWNDGMNRIGPEGRGESVWLGWFLCDVVQRYLPLAAARGDDARVQAWTTARQGWAAALDAAGWDGRWYRRAFFDDGTPLGSAANAEARIDLIAQAFAVLSGAGDPQRAATAMASVRSELFDAEHALLPLLTPPLQHATPSAGYIQAYPPGVRENGGQYNHAAVWGLMAFARLGRAEDAWHCFEAISPAHRWRDPERGARYAIEPYVLAGDVYTAAPHIGRGGWSWYTGAAGWLLHAAVESLCGVVVARGEVTLAPCLPPHWDEATVELRCGALRHRFVLCRDGAALARAHAREAAAERVRPPGPVRLHELVRNTVFIVDARPDTAAAARPGASVVERGARQYQLEQGALAFLRPPDE